MAKRKKSRKRQKKYKYNLGNFGRIAILIFTIIFILVGIDFYFKKQIRIYYLKYFKENPTTLLENSYSEQKRINRIVSLHDDKVFGLDISHYQRKEDVNWADLQIIGTGVELKFILLRGTMGINGKDNHFDHYWKLAKKNNLVRGVYHFYRPNENPIMQANWFLQNTKLESGDLLPVLDIEKLPRDRDLKKFTQNIKSWLDIVESRYHQKPIIYTYYYFYRDYLSDEFKDYPLWLANYNDVDVPAEMTHWDFWQFTEKGIVQGINAKVDLNIFNGDDSDLEKFTIR